MLQPFGTSRNGLSAGCLLGPSQAPQRIGPG